MKHLYTTLITCAIGLSLNAQMITEEVITGAGYENQVWYSLENGTSHSAPLNNWDLAFEITGFTASIRANNQKGLTVFNAPYAIDSWNEVDTAGMSENWTKLYNNEASWNEGAFNRYSTSETDLGWGEYNFITHVISGDSIQIIQLANEAYKKIKIESLASSVYTFTYADLDGANETTVQINKADYSGKNFAYYSIENQEEIDREPTSAEWDITFTKYVADYNGVPYPVAGILQNYNVSVSEIADTDIDVATPTTFAQAINTIGFDWKTFDFTNGWLLTEDLSFFVQRENGDTYQVVFTDFGGSGTGIYEMGLEFYGTLSVLEKTTATFSLFPNPNRTGTLNIAGAFAPDAQLEILDITGRTIWKGNMQSEIEQINISNLINGTYIFRSIVSGTSSTQKFIINK